MVPQMSNLQSDLYMVCRPFSCCGDRVTICILITYHTRPFDSLLLSLFTKLLLSLIGKEGLVACRDPLL